MINFKFIRIFFILFYLLIFTSCAKVRESAGVERKSIDEFQAIENPPLIIPPDYNLIPPDQMKEKDISNIEKELAQEILFGINKNKNNTDDNVSTMNTIISNAKAENLPMDIREQIDKDFANQKSSKGIVTRNWEDQIEILDAISESERIREKNFNEESIAEGDVPIIKQKIKDKKNKKKRFWLF